MTEIMKGTITKIVRKSEGRDRDQGGYFFVRDGAGHDRFAHARDLVNRELDALREGDKVLFVPLTVQSAAKGNGLRAEAIEVVEA